MSQPKYVAESLTSILESQMVKEILNRQASPGHAINTALDWWNLDLESRKPSPAYDEYGTFKGTDLDLACFLYALSGRGAIINIPTYKAHTQTKVREDQVLKSKYDRNGELLNVSANKTFFSFNITIKDQNIIGENEVGDFRTFSLTDKTGEWYEGWRTLQFEPTLKENRFITENKLWSGNKIIFKNFIHPNRWTSFFGRHYVISKMLIERLEEQSKFLRAEIKRLKEAGVDFPSGSGPQKHAFSYGKSKSAKFDAFECKIHIPSAQIVNDYSKLPENQKALIVAYEDCRNYKKAISKLRFMTRASEYAHSKNPDRMPAWIKNVKWESGFREPRKRTDWERLKLFQPAVGQHSISILKRSFEKSATVSAD